MFCSAKSTCRPRPILPLSQYRRPFKLLSSGLAANERESNAVGLCMNLNDRNTLQEGNVPRRKPHVKPI